MDPVISELIIFPRFFFLLQRGREANRPGDNIGFRKKWSRQKSFQ